MNSSTLLVGAALLLGACATVAPPTAEVAASAAAVANAASAGGNEWAPEDMRVARARLDGANTALAARDYPSARSLADEATVTAQLTEARARAVKAHQAAADAADGNRVLREELDRKAPTAAPLPTAIAPRN